MGFDDFAADGLQVAHDHQHGNQADGGREQPDAEKLSEVPAPGELLVVHVRYVSGCEGGGAVDNLMRVLFGQCLRKYKHFLLRQGHNISCLVPGHVLQQTQVRSERNKLQWSWGGLKEAQSTTEAS